MKITVILDEMGKMRAPVALVDVALAEATHDAMCDALLQACRVRYEEMDRWPEDGFRVITAMDSLGRVVACDQLCWALEDGLHDDNGRCGWVASDSMLETLLATPNVDEGNERWHHDDEGTIRDENGLRVAIAMAGEDVTVVAAGPQMVSAISQALGAIEDVVAEDPELCRLDEARQALLEAYKASQGK